MLPRCATIKAVMSALHATTTLQKCEKEQQARAIDKVSRSTLIKLIYLLEIFSRAQAETSRKTSIGTSWIIQTDSNEKKGERNCAMSFALKSDGAGALSWPVELHRPFLIVTQNKIHCSKLFVEFNRSELCLCESRSVFCTRKNMFSLVSCFFCLRLFDRHFISIASAQNFNYATATNRAKKPLNRKTFQSKLALRWWLMSIIIHAFVQQSSGVLHWSLWSACNANQWHGSVHCASAVPFQIEPNDLTD